jgi:hypothetical protein
MDAVAEVVAVVLDDDGETIETWLCPGDDAVEERACVLLEHYAGVAATVVFATVWPGRAVVTSTDRGAFRRVRLHGAAVGLPVLDWLVVGDGLPFSLALDDVVP